MVRSKIRSRVETSRLPKRGERGRKTWKEIGEWFGETPGRSLFSEHRQNTQGRLLLPVEQTRFLPARSPPLR